MNFSLGLPLTILNLVGDFAFTAKGWTVKVANQDDSVVIDCTTNNGNATVYLQFNPHTVWLNLTSDSDLKVNKVGSEFVIPQINNRYLGYYRCVATLMEDNICLVKGPLFVKGKYVYHNYFSHSGFGVQVLIDE